jgi:hypothetical protein
LSPFLQTRTPNVNWNAAEFDFNNRLNSFGPNSSFQITDQFLLRGKSGGQWRAEPVLDYLCIFGVSFHVVLSESCWDHPQQMLFHVLKGSPHVPEGCRIDAVVVRKWAWIPIRDVLIRLTQDL